MVRCKIEWKVAVSISNVLRAEVHKSLRGGELTEHRGVVQRSVVVFTRFVDVRAVGDQNIDCLGIAPLRTDMKRGFARGTRGVHRLNLCEKHAGPLDFSEDLRQGPHAA